MGDSKVSTNEVYMYIPNYADLIGIPFVNRGRNKETGLDCYGLVQEFYKKFDVDTYFIIGATGGRFLSAGDFNAFKNDLKLISFFIVIMPCVHVNILKSVTKDVV